jgi:hypothetical protein
LQRLGGQPLHLLHLLGGPRRIGVCEPRRQLALERDHLQMVALDVVQVGGEPQALVGDRQLRRQPPCPLQPIWVNPWYPSPMVDGGYDVTDYRAIDPLFGTLAEPKP